MFFLGLCVTRLADVAHWIGRVFERAGLLLTEMLPALLPPAALTKLIRTHYDQSYDDTYARFSGAQQEWPLEQWEQDVLARHHILSGNILVLGTGIGRESIALAKRGFHVIGLDISQSALRMAAQIARTAGVPVTFVQADFLALPARPAHFDYILLPSIMYSSIPSRSWRQAWLRQLTSLLAPKGLAALQFLIDSAPSTRRKRVSEAINQWLTRLPGTNRLYQPGDTCPQGHFLHAFQSEQELHQELSESGVVLRELNWQGQYLVVAASSTEGTK
jgi:ubiquinone/menaquinone biosynthesis C-methylase UbiE